MVYSPKIRNDLIKPLYHYSKSIGKPMTKTVNRLLTRGLLLEPLPAEAIATLPSDALDTMRRKGLEDITLETGSITPVSDVREKSAAAKPYLGIDEVNDWYESSIHGLARGLATLDAYRQCHSSRPSSMMDSWFYENAALNLGQTLYHSMALSAGIHMPLADHFVDRVAEQVAKSGYRG